MWAWLLVNRQLVYILSVAVAVVGLSGYVWWLRSSNESKAERIDVLEAQVASYIDEIESYVELQNKYRESEAAVADLQKRLARHDIGGLVRAKPGLVVPIVNRATRRVFDEIEQASSPSD